MKFLITICGRGGSKRLPKKNIRLLAEKPLIAYTIETAFKLTEILNADIALSTDDVDIISTAAKYNLYTNYSRPNFLASDNSGKIDVIKDVLLYHEKKSSQKYDFIIDLDITSPLRTVQDIKKAIDIIDKNHEAFNIFSVSKPYRNPYFNMVEKKENKYFSLVCEQKDYLTTQASPDVYDLNASFYIYRRLYFDKNFKTVYTPKSLVYIMPHICFDIDTIEDFEYMEFVVKNKKFSF